MILPLHGKVSAATHVYPVVAYEENIVDASLVEAIYVLMIYDDQRIGL